LDKARWQGEYYPFGELYWSATNQPNQHRLPGQYQDNESGLYYNWHRYFDPVTGRYRSADPVTLFDPSGNRYGFGYGNPLLFVDRDGRVPVLLAVWGAVELGLAVSPGRAGHECAQSPLRR
jgi:RHS repeat-associated protein